MPPSPSLNRRQHCIPRDGRDALGPTWPAGDYSHKPQAGAAPFRKDRWAAWRAFRLAVARHAGQRASETQARGHGGWRARGAAGGSAASRRAASQAGPALKEVAAMSWQLPCALELPRHGGRLRP
jgi:hypothetical protein